MAHDGRPELWKSWIADYWMAKLIKAAPRRQRQESPGGSLCLWRRSRVATVCPLWSQSAQSLSKCELGSSRPFSPKSSGR